MAGTLIVSNITTDTDNTFIVRSNTGTTLFVANTTSGIITDNATHNGTITGNNATFVGTVTLSGSGKNFVGDFTNATVLNRNSFQTSTANSSTGIYALPNGTSTAASWQATNSSDPTNASKILIATNGSTDVQLVSGRNGSGSYLPLTFYQSGAEQMRLDTGNNFIVGASSQIGAEKLGVSFNDSSLNGLGIQVQGSSSSAGYIIFRNSSGTSIGTVTRNATANSVKYNTTSSGSTGAYLLDSGVAFPATQVPSSDANTLDDYEEGTWTPKNSSAGNLSINNSATYIKIGKLVFINCDINQLSESVVYNLPFTAAATGYPGVVVCGYNSYTAGPLTGVFNGNATTLNLYYNGASNITPTNNRFILAGCYVASA